MLRNLYGLLGLMIFLTYDFNDNVFSQMSNIIIIDVRR